MLARKRAAADGDARAVEVHGELAPGLAVVAVRAGVHHRAVGVEHEVHLAPGRRPARVFAAQPRVGVFEHARRRAADVHERARVALLQRHQQVLEDPAAVFFAQADHELAVRPLASEEAVAA